MKAFSIIASLALATIAAAQAPALPSCAQECANPYLLNGVGTCGTEPGCICANKEFIEGISCCLATKCPVGDQSAAVNFASQFCAGAGVTTLPTTVSCAATAASNTAATTTASTTGSGTGTQATGANQTTRASGNYGPRQTAAAGLGAIGGLVAAVALL